MGFRMRVSKLNPAVFAKFVNARNGPIRMDLNRRATNVQAYQQRTCPQRTGTLLATSRKRQGRGGLRPSVEVIIGKEAKTPYLGYILFGTDAHEIRAASDRPNAHLRFMSGGSVRFAKSVWHPGTRANNFVLASLPEALK